MTTTQTTPARIAAWMRRHMEEHRDGQTGEVDLTGLVEAWDRACASGGDTRDSDHPAWAVAVEVAGQ